MGSLSFEASTHGSVLVHPILDVVGISAKPEMRQSDTKTVVAMMQDVKAFRNSAVSKKPCDSMGSTGATVETKLSIASGACAGYPIPAIVSGIDFGPETFFYGRHN